MKKSYRAEEETFEFVNVKDAIKSNNKKSLSVDDLSCDCLTCQRRKKSCNSHEDSIMKHKEYRQD